MRWRYITTGISIVAMVIALAGHAVILERQLYLDRAMLAAQNIARLLDGNITSAIDKCDAILLSVVVHYGQEIDLDSRELDQYLAQLEASFPEVLNLSVTDEHGNTEYGQSMLSTNDPQARDRELFVRVRDEPYTGLVVSGPMPTRLDRRRVIVLARRLSRGDGTFAGIVYASFNVDFFAKLLSALDLGSHGAATIRAADLSLVQRIPRMGNATGSAEVSDVFRKIANADQQESRYIAVSPIDGIERSNFFRRLQHYPFYVTVGLGTDDYLGEWRRHALTVSAMTAVVIALIGAVGWLLLRRAERLASEIEARRAGEAELRRLSVHTHETIEAERVELARDVHDQIGALLTSMHMRLDLLARDTADNPSMHDGLRDIARLSRQAQAATRAICTRLRPPMLDDLGLVETCRWYVDDWEKHTGILVDARFPMHDPDADLPAADIFRIVQELLTNVARHAEATRVRVSLSCRERMLRLRVTDNGHGAGCPRPVRPNGFGLMGIRERTTRCQGRLAIRFGSFGSGVVISIPLDAPDRHAL